ncbi:MAG: hypothetical protein AB7T10_03120 [bacterium]
MNILKSRNLTYKIAILLLFFILTAMLGIRESNWAFLFFSVILLSIFILMLITDSIVPMLLFLSIYGLVYRIMFFYTGGLLYSLLFIIPFFIVLLFIDSLIENFNLLSLPIKIFLGIYCVLALYISFAFSIRDPLSSMVSFNVYFTPVLLILTKRFEYEDLSRTIKIAFPFILGIFILQIAGKYFYFDRYYFDSVGSYIYTSLKLGSHYRPFSTFSSVEELSVFLALAGIAGFSGRGVYMKTIAVLSFASLLFLSARTAMFILIILGMLYILKCGRYKVFAVISILFIILIISLQFIQIDTTVYKKDSRMTVIFKHTVEPLKSGFNTYSAGKRIESMRFITEEIKKHPFGKGMTHSESVLLNQKQEHPIESSFAKLSLSGGIITLLYLCFVYIFSLAKLFTNKTNESHYIILFSLLTILLMNGLTMHFISVVIAASLIKFK